MVSFFLFTIMTICVLLRNSRLTQNTKLEWDETGLSCFSAHTQFHPILLTSVSIDKSTESQARCIWFIVLFCCVFNYTVFKETCKAIILKKHTLITIREISMAVGVGNSQSFWGLFKPRIKQDYLYQIAKESEVENKNITKNWKKMAFA